MSRSVKDKVAYLEEKNSDHYVLFGLASETYFEVKRRLNFTNRVVDELPFAGDGKERVHWDLKLPGFGVSCGKTSKRYYVQADIDGKTRQAPIGRTTLYTAEEARKRARQLLQQMREGRDPVAEGRRRKKIAAAERVTLERAFEDFLKGRNLKEATKRDYRGVFDNTLGGWKKRPVTVITRADVAHRHSKLKQSSGHHYADYAMRILSAVLNDATARHDGPDGGPLLLSNPVKILSQTKAWAKMKPREEFIDEPDLPKFLKALDDIRTDKSSLPSGPVGCDFFELLTFTGLRKTEAASLKWEQVDFDRKILTVRETKNEQPHVIPLTDHLIKLLDRRKNHADEVGSDWVFPSPGRKNRDGYLADPRSVADLVTDKCGVKFRNHDLRRTFITACVRAGVSEFFWKRLLNHSMGGSVTYGYIQAKVEDLREAMEAVTGYLLQMRAKGQDMRMAGEAS